jgi:hypothetical protein
MQVQLHFSESLVRRAVRRFWWRTVGWRYIGTFAAMLAYLVFTVWNGDRSWWVGALATLLIVGTIIPAAVYFVHMRRTLSKFREMHDPVCVLELGDDRVGLRSDSGAAELEWKAVTDVWCFPEAWLMFFSRSQFATLPTADLNAEAQNLIRAKGAAVGFKVR